MKTTKKNNGKIRNIVMIVTLVLVLGATAFLVGCGNSDSGNSGNSGNPGGSSGQQQVSPGGNYDNMMLGFGRGDDLSMEYPGGTPGGHIDISMYLSYAQRNFLDNGSQPGYHGETLEYPASGGSFYFRTEDYKEVSGYGWVLELVPGTSGVKFVSSKDGQTYNYDDQCKPRVFYSTERGILAVDEWQKITGK